MNTYTFDTTVLAEGLVKPRREKKDAVYEERKKRHEKAKAFLREVETGEAVMYVPTAALVEIAAVVSRLTGKEERGREASEYVQTHAEVLYDWDILQEAVQLAAETAASGFDNVFLTVAKETDSTLLTNDSGMHSTAQNIGIESILLRDNLS